MSEEHKTERTRSWQAASPCRVLLSAELVIQEATAQHLRCLHSEGDRHGWRGLWAPGRPLRTRGCWWNRVLKGHRVAATGLRAAHRVQEVATGPKRWDPPTPRHLWEDPL